MNIRFFEKKQQRLLSCNFIIPIGTTSRCKTKKNFAHLIEHLIFRGHPKLNQCEFMEKIESFGAIINAFTDDRHTVIFVRVDKKYLMKVVELVYEAICKFEISEKDLEEETKIVNLEEKQQYIERYILDQVLEFESETEKIDISEILEIYRKCYKVENWTLLIVGELDELSKREIYKYSTIEKFAETVKPYNVLIPKESKYMMCANDTQKYFVYYHPFTKLCDKVYVKIIKHLLVSGFSSYFYREIVEKRGYSYSIGFQDLYYDRTAFIIYCNCSDENINDIYKLFTEVFETSEFFDTLSNEDLYRAIKMTITEYRLKSENISSLVQDIIESIILDTRFEDFDKIVDMLTERESREILEDIKKILFG